MVPFRKSGHICLRDVCGRVATADAGSAGASRCGCMCMSLLYIDQTVNTCSLLCSKGSLMEY